MDFDVLAVQEGPRLGCDVVRESLPSVPGGHEVASGWNTKV